MSDKKKSKHYRDHAEIAKKGGDKKAAEWLEKEAKKAEEKGD